MRIAMFGTRGVPARYGGFETCVEEVGKRLVARGHEVTVYCRDTDRAQTGKSKPRPKQYLGMHLVHLPALPKKITETFSHMGLSVAHALPNPPDMAFVFNAANSPWLPFLRARKIPVATHVDGLEWKRAKWGSVGRYYYRSAEALAVRWSDALIADARGIQDYYLDRFSMPTEYIPYGAPILHDVGTDHLDQLGVKPQRYHFVIARFEPENHVDLIVRGYLRSSCKYPLIIIGSAPYADQYTARIERLAGKNPNIYLLGPVWDQLRIDQLYAHALTYVHGHSVGGTNPALLRAMGAGAATLAFDVNFNREVLGEYGQYFADPTALAELLEKAEALPEETVSRGRAQLASLDRYNWDVVAQGYEDLAARLVYERGLPRTRRTPGGDRLS